MGKPSAKPSKCAVCLHPERARIELLCAGGGSFRVLATRFNLHRDQVWRHWRAHVDEETRAVYIAGPAQLSELAERAAAEGMSLLDYLNVLRTVLFGQFSAAAAAGDARATALVASRLLAVLREVGKFTGEIVATGASFTQNNLILASPEVAAMQAAIIDALAPYPEARAAVVQALRQLDEESRDEDDDAGGMPAVASHHVISGEVVHAAR